MGGERRSENVRSWCIYLKGKKVKINENIARKKETNSRGGI